MHKLFLAGVLLALALPLCAQTKEYICQENNQDVSRLVGPTAAPGDPERPAGTSGGR